VYFSKISLVYRLPSPLSCRERKRRAVALLLDNSEEVFFAHDEQFVAVDLDGLAAVLAEQHAIADLDIEDDELALVTALAWADGQHFTLIGLFCGVVGDDDALGGLGFLLEALDDHAIVQRTKFHSIS
jgi:hypothetical protein